MSQVELTYADLLQPIKPWVSSAPKLSETVVDLIPKQEESDSYADSSSASSDKETSSLDTVEGITQNFDTENQQN